MPHKKFDVAKLERLNDEARFQQLDPDRMWAALGRPDPETIVEIGAGTGLFAARFAGMAPRATVYAVDIEQVMIDWMRANRPEVATGRIVPVLGEETKVPLADGVADLAFMINLHHELVHPEHTYAEALRLLHDGGQLLVVDWAPIETPKGPPQRVRISSSRLAEMLRSVGFAEVVVHPPLVWHSLVTAVK
jgi:ubiquinone/menaquinone biosynthesis C-methylase UbiE